MCWIQGHVRLTLRQVTINSELVYTWLKIDDTRSEITQRTNGPRPHLETVFLANGFSTAITAVVVARVNVVFIITVTVTLVVLCATGWFGRCCRRWWLVIWIQAFAL